MKLKDYFSNNLAVLALIFINLLIFVALYIFPNLSGYLLLNPEPSVVAERPWTLITVLFSHEILIHFLLNMFLVFVFGTQLSRETNAKIMYCVYILCGFLGSLTILAYAPLVKYDGDAIAGASAAAFGIVTAYAALQPNKSILKSKAIYWVIALFVFNAILTIRNPRISVGGPAHAIGIIAGLIIGFMLKRKYPKKSKSTIRTVEEN